MDDHAPLGRCAAARLLIGLLAVLCLAVPLLAGPGESPEEKNEAEKVAKKVEKAAGTAHQAEEEREALRHFQEEVADYAELHAKQLAKLGCRPADAAEPSPRRQALAARHRGEARQGQAGRHLPAGGPAPLPAAHRGAARGPGCARRAEGGPRGKPGAGRRLGPGRGAGQRRVPARRTAVHGAAERAADASTACPRRLHYRFVGRDLLLVDSVAQLIVDFLPAAAPDLAVK